MDITAVTPTIGAEVAGIDLRRPLPADELASLRQALLDHLVLFFRDQPLTPTELVAFGAQLGPVITPTFATRGQEVPEVTLIDQVDAPRGDGNSTWHSDNPVVVDPPMATALQALQLPDVGGDTCFANMYAAYDALSPALQRLVDDLDAVNDITSAITRAAAAGRTTADVDALRARFPPVEHPVARTHPETGRRALYVNRNATTRLVGLTDREQELLLPFLVDHVRDPAFQCRFRWELGSLALWDNRCTQHCGVLDFAGRRVLQRITIGEPAPLP
jgi:taurine dioxygenase